LRITKLLSKDHRPDRRQMIVGAVLTAAGQPVCCELWPASYAFILVPINLGGQEIFYHFIMTELGKTDFRELRIIAKGDPDQVREYFKVGIIERVYPE
jgi:hypothetical protein